MASDVLIDYLKSKLSTDQEQCNTRLSGGHKCRQRYRSHSLHPMIFMAWLSCIFPFSRAASSATPLTRSREQAAVDASRKRSIREVRQHAI
jgi:hypothetical protein